MSTNDPDDLPKPASCKEDGLDSRTTLFFSNGCNVDSDVVAFQGDICYAAGKSFIVVNFVKSDTGEC